MSIPKVLGISRATLGGIFVVAWLVAIGVALYRYDRKRLSRNELLLASGGALMWLAWSLLHVVDAFSGRIALGIDVLSLALFVCGAALSIHWWRTRKSGETQPE